jgi:hypothetical protein
MTEDEALKAAYLAGFNASGEGYNGEYPFHGAHPEQDAGWIKNRDNEITAIKQALAAPVQPEHISPKQLLSLAKEANLGLDKVIKVFQMAQPAPTVQEPVATKLKTEQFNCFHVSAEDFKNLKALPVGTKLYTTPPTQPAPTVQEPSEMDLQKCWVEKSDGTIDGIASMRLAIRKYSTTPPAAQPAPVQEPVLQDIEQYRLQTAGISTAALGYWKEGDGIHPDYDTPALRDVAKLYAKYDALYTAAQPAQPAPVHPVALHRDLHSHLMVVAHRAVDLASSNGQKAVSQKEIVRAICKAIQTDKNLLAKLTPPAAPVQPVQEPVADAWMHKDGRLTDAKAKTARVENFHGWRPLAFIASATPPAAPVQDYKNRAAAIPARGNA